MPKSAIVIACLLLAACVDPNRIAGTDCKEPWINVKPTASIDDLAAWIALPPPPPCYYVAPHGSAPRHGSVPSF